MGQTSDGTRLKTTPKREILDGAPAPTKASVLFHAGYLAGKAEVAGIHKPQDLAHQPSVGFNRSRKFDRSIARILR